MKKKLCLFLACAMTAILLFGCSSSNSGDTAEGQEEVTTPGSNIEYEQDGSLPPLDKDLQTLYQEAQALYEQISLTGFEMDSSDTLEKDGMVYFKVTDSRFRDYDSFYSYLNKYFTKDFIDEEILAESNLRFAKSDDGGLYVLDGNRGTNIFFAGYVMTVDSQTDKEILFTSTAYYTIDTPNEAEIFYTAPEDPENYTTKTYQFDMIQEDGSWKFDNFYLFY